ncbi:MAG: hypothetical protein HQK77_08795 [Desulfobacterales bacterium]|nr:hypothetical protein [Desulfobacterales bacterium]
MKLSQRETYTLYGGLIIGGILIIFFMIISPFLEKRSRLIKLLTAKEKVYTQLSELKSEYELLKTKSEIYKTLYEKREKGFALFSFLDQLAGKAGIKENISYMKPSSDEKDEGPYKLTKVEMKLQSIRLDQLTQFLYTVEISANLVYVKRLSIVKTTNQAGLLDVILQVETLVTA